MIIPPPNVSFKVTDASSLSWCGSERQAGGLQSTWVSARLLSVLLSWKHFPLLAPCVLLAQLLCVLGCETVTHACTRLCAPLLLPSPEGLSVLLQAPRSQERLGNCHREWFSEVVLSSTLSIPNPCGSSGFRCS